MIDLFARAKNHGSRIAIRDPKGCYTYHELLHISGGIANDLLQTARVRRRCIAFLVKPSFAYVATQWGIWRSGSIAAPLCNDHPLSAMANVMKDAEVSQLVVVEEPPKELSRWCAEQGVEILKYSNFSAAADVDLPKIEMDQSALILYTSGTTGLPKGVVTTHANIEAQVKTLVEAWQWQKTDHILNILPLHHVHGIINVLTCALWSGACCEFIDRFSPASVWNSFRLGFVNVFMAVPTVYYKLIKYWEDENQSEQRRLSDSLAHFRLMVSGSAALPVSVLEKWEALSGHRLLERYGMTEIGMALSNPYDGERRPGHVGRPLPGVWVRLADEKTNLPIDGGVGEIQIKGKSVFKEYWKKPGATRKAFSDDGWFKTGDIAIINQGYFQILGRNSVDIIKSGGYKISALQIEEAMRKNQDILDCAVVGIPDLEWGEVVAVAFTSPTEACPVDPIKLWLRDYLPPYQIPRMYRQVEALPRNTIGKVTKKVVKELFL